MNCIHKLAQLFSQFPGIGPRQAKRFVYYLLTTNKQFVSELSKLISEIQSHMSVCTSCFRFFDKGTGSAVMCSICRDKNRDESLLMVVSRDVDLDNIEKSGSFNGKYFVLGGIVPILEENPEEKIRLRELLNKIELLSGGLKEVVLGMSANSEGEHTGDVVKEALSSLSAKHNIKISTLGRGLSTGTELEYSDSETLKSALKNRQ